MSEADDTRFEALLAFLQQQRGLDYTGYKRPSLRRRIERRMQMVGAADFDAYVDYLEVHPEEFALLFDSILINVTSFFRDEAAWSYLRDEVVPRLLDAKPAPSPLRIWSAGCASGQEAYSLAMVFAEALGEEEFRQRVKIYGTDADEHALGQARLASYSPKEMEGVDRALVERYFDSSGGSSVFRPDLRRAVIFGRHDLLQDAPISRLDLLVCRNTMMYFNAEMQSRILERFHFALNGHGKSHGYLFLGRAEMLLTQTELFTPLNLKCRVFVTVPRPAARPRAAVRLDETPKGTGTGIEIMPVTPLSTTALDDSPVARIIIGADGALALANHQARRLFAIEAGDIGRPLRELDIARQPLELSPLIEQAHAQRRAVTHANAERHQAKGERQYFDVVVAPLYDGGRESLGTSVTFLDVTRYFALNEELQSSNEELETTNEELHSSNEELETTNEELQSTNEELETMNEELQSTNEELQTVNEELRQRTDESNHLNAFLESVMSSLRAAAVVVNQNLDVLMWNRRSEDLWGLRADEVQGRGLLNLDIGLPVAELRGVIRPCLSGDSDHEELTLDAINRRGKKIRCRVTVTPLVTASKKRQGVILLMEDEAA